MRRTERLLRQPPAAGRPSAAKPASTAAQPEQKYLLDCLPELKGKILGCWCVKKPIDFIRKDKVCHGEVLLELVERYGNN
jgi:Domain of unknown function (DUF4326)